MKEDVGIVLSAVSAAGAVIAVEKFNLSTGNRMYDAIIGGVGVVVGYFVLNGESSAVVLGAGLGVVLNAIL